MAPVNDWSSAGLLRHLGYPPDYVPPTEAEEWSIYERCIDLLRVSGYDEKYKWVYKVGGAWQAKPYVRPKTQRHLGDFATPREAAAEVLSFKMGDRPLPPSPSKDRNKRGTGRKPRDRRKGAQPALSPAMHVVHIPDSMLLALLAVPGIDSRGTHHSRKRKEREEAATRTPCGTGCGGGRMRPEGTVLCAVAMPQLCPDESLVTVEAVAL